MSSLHPILNMQFDHTLCFVSQSSPFVALQEIFHLHSSQFLFLVPLPPTLIDKTIGETTIFLCNDLVHHPIETNRLQHRWISGSRTIYSCNHRTQRHLAWEAFKPPPDPPILPELKASEEAQKQRRTGVGDTIRGTTLLMMEDEYFFSNRWHDLHQKGCYCQLFVQPFQRKCWCRNSESNSNLMTHRLFFFASKLSSQVSGSCPRVMVDNCWGYLSDGKSWDGWDLCVKTYCWWSRNPARKPPAMKKHL